MSNTREFKRGHRTPSELHAGEKDGAQRVSNPIFRDASCQTTPVQPLRQHKQLGFIFVGGYNYTNKNFNICTITYHLKFNFWKKNTFRVGGHDHQTTPLVVPLPIIVTILCKSKNYWFHYKSLIDGQKWKQFKNRNFFLWEMIYLISL